MNNYLNDLMAFADLLAACNVIHEEAVSDADGYDGGTTMARIAEAHRRLKAESADKDRLIAKLKDQLTKALEAMVAGKPQPRTGGKA